MGAVYLGEHTMLGRPAAIKILLPALSQNREMVGRFFNEARATTAIRHPGIVEIYDFGFLPDGAAYIAMELLDGESVASRLRRCGRLPLAAAIDIGRQVAAALHAAHSRGITHRDLKPDNMFLIRDPEIGERVKLLDFGIAKLVAEDGSNRTRTGVVMGTPVYMSPEQCRGAAGVDSRADLYSLGCVLHELLTGRPPFVAESASDIIAHHLYFQPEPVRKHDPSMPEALEQLIMALLAKDPASRPASAAEVGSTLDGWRATGNVSAGGAMSSLPQPMMRPPAVAAGATGNPIAAATPTTLSGAAGVATTTSSGQKLGQHARSSRRRVVAIGTTVVAAGAISIAVTLRLTRPSEGPTAASGPASSAALVSAAAPPLAAVSPSTPPPATLSTVAPSTVAPSSVAPSTVAPSTVARPSSAAVASASAPSSASPSPATSVDRSAPPGPEPAVLQARAPAGAATPGADKPAARPPRTPARAAPSKPETTPPRKGHDAAATTPGTREEQRPVAAVGLQTEPVAAPPKAEPIAAPPRAEPVAAPPRAEPVKAEPVAAPPRANTEPTPAQPGAPAKPATSKWGRLTGDKNVNADDYHLLQECKLAAAKGDCASVRAIAARIAEKNVAMYRARVVTDAAVVACLNTK